MSPNEPPDIQHRLPSALRVKQTFVLALAAAAVWSVAIPIGYGAQAETAGWIESGKPWTDTDGQAIDAHSAGLLKVTDTYYWYGESYRLGLGSRTGISCYSSADLYPLEK